MRVRAPRPLPAAARRGGWIKLDSRGPVLYRQLRKGELVALRWLDVDLEAGRIRVRRNFVCGEFGTPKSTRSSRSVPITTAS